MYLSPNERASLVLLSERASDLLVDIVDEELPVDREPSELDIEFKSVIGEMYEVCSLLSDSYVLMYNHVQKEKISSESTYYKRLRRNQGFELEF